MRAILILCALHGAASDCPANHEASACRDITFAGYNNPLGRSWSDDSAECCFCSSSSYGGCSSGYTYSQVAGACDGISTCVPVATCCVPEGADEEEETDDCALCPTPVPTPIPTPLPTPIPTPAPTMTQIATLGPTTPWSLTIVMIMIFAPIALVLVLFKRSPLRLQHAKNMLCPCLRMNPKFAIRGIVSDSDADATVEILSEPPPNLGLTIGRADEGGPCFIKAITPDSPLLGILVTNDVFTSVNGDDARALDASEIEARLSSDCLLSVAMAPMRGKATSSSGDLPGSNAKLGADAKLGGCLTLCANIYAASNVGKVQILEGLDFLNQLTLVVLHFAAIIMTFTQRVATGTCARARARKSRMQKCPRSRESLECRKC